MISSFLLEKRSVNEINSDMDVALTKQMFVNAHILGDMTVGFGQPAVGEWASRATAPLGFC